MANSRRWVWKSSGSMTKLTDTGWPTSASATARTSTANFCWSQS